MRSPARAPAGPSLPLARTPLVGRGREVAAIANLLLCSDVALLTLTGTAGIGKTRLALQVAADLRDRFASVVFVSLAPISDPGLVAATIATAFDLADDDDLPLLDRLCAHLRRQSILLVLDNVEHLVTAGPMIAELLTACPSLQILATSRTPLRLTVEHEFPVPPLQLPPPGLLPPLAELAGIEAVDLFARRARAVDPFFTLTAENAPSIAAICTNLDGLPLAIELAAARTRLLAPSALLTRLTNRLSLLTGGPRDQPLRLRSMRDAIAWSFDLLAAEEQALFRRLAVFAGGIGLDEAASVSQMTASRLIGSDRGPPVVDPAGSEAAPAFLAQITALVDASLIDPMAPCDREPRFRFLATVQEFGIEQLTEAGEEIAARDAHAQTFLALVEAVEPMLRGSDQAMWFRRLECEHPNVERALSWFRERGDFAAALRMAGALGRFWEARGYLAWGRGCVLELLTMAGTDTASAVPLAVRAKAESCAGNLAYWQGNFAEAETLLAAALRHHEDAQDAWGTANALLNLGQVCCYRGDLVRARELIAASLARFQDIGDAWGVAAATTGLVNPYLEAGDIATVDRLLREGLPLVRATGDQDLLAMTLINLGWVRDWQRRDDESERALLESVEIFQRIGERRTIPYPMNMLGLLTWRRGDRDRAATYFSEALTLSRDRGNRLAVVNSLTALLALDAPDAELAAAAGLLGAAQALRQSIGAPVQPVERPAFAEIAAALERTLGEPAFTAALSRGRAATLESAVQDALAFIARLASACPRTSDAQPLPPNDAAVSLSQRELEVLRLLVEGHSNPEIAAALFISQKTVRNHVTHILGKIGVETRTAAATFALRHGLV